MAVRVYLYFPTASRLIEAVMERGARRHQGEDWRALPAGFHLARARRHLDLLAGGFRVAPAGGGEVTYTSDPSGIEIH